MKNRLIVEVIFLSTSMLDMIRTAFLTLISLLLLHYLYHWLKTQFTVPRVYDIQTSLKQYEKIDKSLAEINIKTSPDT